MLRYGEIKVAQEEFYWSKKPTKIWDVDINHIVISKLVETRNSSKYLIG